MKTLTMVQQQILPGAGSWFITSWCVTLRFVLAGIVLAVFSLGELRTVSRREMEQGIWLAFFVAVGISLQMDGLSLISASTSAFLTQLYCVLIPIWVALSQRRFPGMKIFICCVMVLVGMGLLVNLNIHDLRLGRGELETLGGSVMFTAQILCLEHPRYAGTRTRCFTVIMLLAVALFTMPVVALTAPSVAACVQVYHSVPAWVLLSALVLICSLGPFLLMNRWQREVSATEAGLIYCAEPVFVSVIALFLPGWFSRWAGVDYPNEHVTASLLLGGGLVTAANVLLQSRWLEPKQI